MSSLGMHLSKKLKEIRESHRRTQEWLADKLNLSRATINRWETKGAGSATLDELEIIADHLKKSPGYLLGITQATSKEPGNAELIAALSKLQARVEELERQATERRSPIDELPLPDDLKAKLKEVPRAKYDELVYAIDLLILGKAKKEEQKESS